MISTDTTKLRPPPNLPPTGGGISIALTDEFTRAFELLEHSTQNLFLTGKAGTGKSTFLNYFRSHTRKRHVVLAPTGVAALNVQGQTIHSFFHLPPRFVDKRAIKRQSRRVFKELELLIIDEISMVRADVFEGMDAYLRLNGPKKGEPFGGVQLCVIGDLFQLPPVVTPDEQEFFQQYYTSPFFFATESYQAAAFKMLEFTKVHRQADAQFIHLLNRIRDGTGDAQLVQDINRRAVPIDPAQPASIILTATNSVAERTNAEKLAALPGQLHSYHGELSGNFGLNGARLPAPELLQLKLGAQVMFTRNDSEGCWVNGTLGTVTQLEEGGIRVRVDSAEYAVEPEKWETLAYEFSEEHDRIVEKPLGEYHQYPLMLAWAITIHKSQGKTLDRVVIDLGRGAFAPGQLYVALSRCRKFEHITLKQRVTQADIRCDARVVAFTRGMRNVMKAP